MSTLEIAALSELVLCWILWVYPFWARARQQRGKQPVITAPTARWGIGLQMVAFFFAWLRTIRSNPPVFLIATMVIAPLSAWFAWRAVEHLGKQWRIQAGLYADHELIRTGPYAIVRHPIYASLFGMLLATGLVMTWWPILIVAAAIYLAGTEVRIRAEDTLLASRFGEVFEHYRAAVPAYIPFIR